MSLLSLSKYEIYMNRVSSFSVIKRKNKQICGMDVLFLANTRPHPIVVSVMYPDFTGFFLM